MDCTFCRYPLNPACMCDECRVKSDREKAAFEFCHVCKQMFRAAYTRASLRDAQKHWEVEQAAKKRMIAGNNRPMLPPPSSNT